VFFYGGSQLLLLLIVCGVAGALGGLLFRVSRAVKRLSSSRDEFAALAEVDALRQEVQSLSGEMCEVQERLDFAERLLAQARAKGLLGSGVQG
jgi:hypothetical protein